MVRKIAGLLIALGVLTFVWDSGSAGAAAKERSHTAKSSAHKSSAKKQATRKKARKVATRKAAKTQSLAITTKPPNDAPDFDFSKRIEDAQALAMGHRCCPGTWWSRMATSPALSGPWWWGSAPGR
jgi:nitrogen fixation protein FixH